MTILLLALAVSALIFAILHGAYQKPPIWIAVLLLTIAFIVLVLLHRDKLFTVLNALTALSA